MQVRNGEIPSGGLLALPAILSRHICISAIFWCYCTWRAGMLKDICSTWKQWSKPQHKLSAPIVDGIKKRENFLHDCYPCWRNDFTFPKCYVYASTGRMAAAMTPLAPSRSCVGKAHPMMTPFGRSASSVFNQFFCISSFMFFFLVFLFAQFSSQQNTTVLYSTLVLSHIFLLHWIKVFFFFFFFFFFFQ